MKHMYMVRLSDCTHSNKASTRNISIAGKCAAVTSLSLTLSCKFSSNALYHELESV
jgi:hypothetical protein